MCSRRIQEGWVGGRVGSNETETKGQFVNEAKRLRDRNERDFRLRGNCAECYVQRTNCGTRAAIYMETFKFAFDTLQNSIKSTRRVRLRTGLRVHR